MNTQRPAVVTIAAILLIVLSLFIGGLGIAQQFGLLGVGFGGRQILASQFRNRNFTPPNGFPSNGFPSGGFQNNGTPNDQNNGGTTPNFTPNRQIGTGLNGIFRLLRPVTIGLDIILLILSAVAVFGLFKSKRWGAILSIVLSVLVILLTIPGFLRIFSANTMIENVVRILFAAVVIVLLLLPTARKSYLPAHDDDY
jgi:hypothetical protein